MAKDAREQEAVVKMLPEIASLGSPLNDEGNRVDILLPPPVRERLLALKERLRYGGSLDAFFEHLIIFALKRRQTRPMPEQGFVGEAGAAEAIRTVAEP